MSLQQTSIDSKHKKQKHVAVLIYDGLCMFEFACVAEIFGLPRPELGNNWYQFSTASVDGKDVSCQYQGKITPTSSLEHLPDIDTLIIPGWSNTNDSVPKKLINKLNELHKNGCRLLSICSGVFVLAETGLLNGKSATTHWRYVEKLAQRFPEINVQVDVLFVNNGSIMTSAGSAAGIDLCLHLVREDYGAETVNSVARRLVVPPLREGNQAQFIEQPVPNNSRHSIAPVLEKITKNIAAPHTVKSLANSMNMSERTLLRRFKASTGTSPGEWIIEARIQFAKELLERTELSIDLVAEQSGLGTAMTLRHHFRTRLNIAPAAYRKRFSLRSITALNKTLENADN